MEIDAEKLIVSIEDRPAIYDYTIKEHHNRDLTEKLWGEISEVVGGSIPDCKIKWNSLRNSYTRFLREEKQNPSGSGGIKRKRWYLTVTMSFLKSFIGQYRKPASNATAENIVAEDVPIEDSTGITDDENVSEDSRSNSVHSMFTSIPTKTVRMKKQSAIESVAEPMIVFLKSRTESVSSVATSSTSKFLESLVVDVEKLSSKRLRIFKSKVLTLLNNMMDEKKWSKKNLNLSLNLLIQRHVYQI